MSDDYDLRLNEALNLPDIRNDQCNSYKTLVVQNSLWTQIENSDRFLLVTSEIIAHDSILEDNTILGKYITCILPQNKSVTELRLSVIFLCMNWKRIA